MRQSEICKIALQTFGPERQIRKWIDAEIAKIKRNTNLNLRNFFDLHDLYQLAVSEVSK